MTKLVIIRHGENIWNFENKFCGWTDVDMTKKGREQTKTLAKLLVKNKFDFDVCYTSVLKRAIESSWIILKEMELTWIPVHKSWRLNERHYGSLQGHNKAKLAKKYGKEQVDKWRWSYREMPPPLSKKDKRHPHHDRRYSSLDETNIPFSESIYDTYKRVMPYWRKKIAPDIKKGKRVLICGHKNCSRAIIKHIEGVKEEDVPKIDVPLGVIVVYEMDAKLKPQKKYFIEY